MTLEQAILHCKEVAEQYEAYGIETECYECGKEHRQLAEWLEDYKQLKEATRWIPCSDRIPERSMPVLISAQGHRITAFYDAVKGVFMLTEAEGLFYSMSAVTHWMPLPDPPEAEDKA